MSLSETIAHNRSLWDWHAKYGVHDRCKPSECEDAPGAPVPEWRRRMLERLEKNGRVAEKALDR